MSLESRARDFATKAHEGQLRKYTGEPYIVHPLAVAELVKSVPHTSAMVAAALLHDTVEDTNVTLDDLRVWFGDVVAALVEQLTDVSKLEDGDRATRKELDRLHLAAASADAQTVKLADLLNNSESIMEHDPGFGRVYLQEKVELLKVLTKGDRKLMAKCKAVVKAAGREVA